MILIRLAAKDNERQPLQQLRLLLVLLLLRREYTDSATLSHGDAICCDKVTLVSASYKKRSYNECVIS